MKHWFSALLVAMAIVVGTPAAAAGEDESALHTETLRTRGCLACHSLDGRAAVGPTFLGLMGSERRGRGMDGDEQRLIADEAFVRASVTDPGAFVAHGFTAGTMPRLPLPAEELDALVRAVAYVSAHPPSPDSLPAEGTLLSLMLAVAGFVMLHLMLSARPLRAPVTQRIGEGPFQGVYSLIVGGFFAWMIWAWSKAPYVELWPSPGWTRWFPIALMPVALYLMIAGSSTRNPTSAGQQKHVAAGPRGIIRVTRHPVLWSYVVWSLSHLPANGDVGSLLLFGGIAALALAGMVHIDRRRQAESPEAWEAFARQTSLVPFAAVLGGRTRMSLAELGWVRPTAALGIYGGVLLAHELVIGVSPFPF